MGALRLASWCSAVLGENMMRAITLVIAVQLIGSALGDLPVHCLHKHVRGMWTFHLGAANMDKAKISSGAHMCSKGVTTEYGSQANGFGLSSVPNFPVQKQIKVELLHPNIARTTVAGKAHEGTWTMIYDEGFEVNVAGSKFFAFSKYTTDNDSTSSLCGETFPGWFHPAKNVDAAKWGCYYGVKDTAVAPVQFRKFGDRIETSEDVFVAEHELIAMVNSQHDGGKSHWRAKRYEKFEGQPMAAIQRQFGTVLKPYKLNPSDRSEQQGWANDVLIDISDLPDSWDWRNVNGKNFIGPVINQGACGSCYSVAVSEMVTARMRIVANDPTLPKTSPDRVIKCGLYSQGCQGGFPYLAAKFLQDFGSVNEKDQPYSDVDGTCPAKVPVASRNVDYKYIGGYYGACGERAMMRDLFDHGPITVGFEVGMGFHTYEQGIFHTTEHLPEKNHWERVNHAVVIVGYGTEHGVDFWTVKNSWGQDWGENGYFRIRRGDDNLNIEHMSVAAYPSVGASLPPKKGETFMSVGESMGHKLLVEQTSIVEKPSTGKATATQPVPVEKRGPHKPSKIYDPAFTRNTPHAEVAPVMEEVQMSDDAVSEDTDAVVEEQDAEEWPEA